MDLKSTKWPRSPAVARSRLEWNKRVSRLHGLPVVYLNPLQPHRAAGNGRISISLSTLWFVKKRGGKVLWVWRIDPRSVRDIKSMGPNGNCHGKKGRWHAVDQTKFPLPNPFQDNIPLTFWGLVQLFPTLQYSRVCCIIQKFRSAVGGFVTFWVDRTKIPRTQPHCDFSIYPSVESKKKKRKKEEEEEDWIHHITCNIQHRINKST